MNNTYSIFEVDNEHANQGSQCSFVPTYTLVVHNTALYQLGGAQYNVVNLSVHLFFNTLKPKIVQHGNLKLGVGNLCDNGSDKFEGQGHEDKIKAFGWELLCITTMAYYRYQFDYQL